MLGCGRLRNGAGTKWGLNSSRDRGRLCKRDREQSYEGRRLAWLFDPSSSGRAPRFLR